MRPLSNSPSLLSDELKELEALCDDPPLTFRKIIDHLGNRSHATLCLFLSLPFLFPIPLPGLSIAFGVAIFGLALRFTLRLDVWLPRFLLDRDLPRASFKKLLSTSSKIFSKIEWLFRPRGLAIQGSWTHTIAGIVLMTSALLLSLPLPPGTNLPPALTIVLISIGILERDFALLAGGTLVFLLTLLLFGILAVLGWDGVGLLLQHTRSGFGTGFSNGSGG